MFASSVERRCHFLGVEEMGVLLRLVEISMFALPSWCVEGGVLELV